MSALTDRMQTIADKLEGDDREDVLMAAAALEVSLTVLESLLNWSVKAADTFDWLGKILDTAYQLVGGPDNEEEQ